jgi:hypothetical protein
VRRDWRTFAFPTRAELDAPERKERFVYGEDPVRTTYNSLTDLAKLIAADRLMPRGYAPAAEKRSRCGRAGPPRQTEQPAMRAP